MSANFCLECGSSLTEKQIQQERRKACSAPGCRFVFYDNPTPVVGAIIEYSPTKDDPNTQIVLVQGRGWPKDWFGLVTGFLERGETVQSGCLREVKEELGLEGEIVELMGVYDFARMNQVIMVYHVRAWGEIKMDTTELADYKLVPVHKLKPWPFGTGPAVADFLLKQARKARNQDSIAQPRSKL